MFDLAELLKTTAEEMRSLAEHKNLNLEVLLFGWNYPALCRQNRHRRNLNMLYTESQQT